MNKLKIVEIFNRNIPNKPMTSEQTDIMMHILMSKDNTLSIDLNEIDKESQMYNHFKPLIESFQAQVFLKRIELLTTLRMSLGALIILMQYMLSPGACVMYAYYLHYKLPKNTLVTINEICCDLFGMGFFQKNN